MNQQELIDDAVAAAYDGSSGINVFDVLASNVEIYFDNYIGPYSVVLLNDVQDYLNDQALIDEYCLSDDKDIIDEMRLDYALALCESKMLDGQSCPLISGSWLRDRHGRKALIGYEIWGDRSVEHIIVGAFQDEDSLWEHLSKKSYIPIETLRDNRSFLLDMWSKTKPKADVYA